MILPEEITAVRRYYTEITTDLIGRESARERVLSLVDDIETLRTLLQEAVTLCNDIAKDYYPGLLDNHTDDCPMRIHPVGRVEGAKCTCDYEAKFKRYAALKEKIEKAGI